MGFSFGKSWEADLDRYLTTPPEDELPESRIKCCECGEELYPGDYVYKIEGDYLCEDHAEEWLKSQRIEIDEEMAFGE